jgi:hypothetical protein
MRAPCRAWCDRRSTAGMALRLLAALVTGAAFGAGTPATGAQPGEASSPTASRVGLLPPVIVLLEETAGTGGRPVASVEGSATAGEAVGAAFVEAMTARKIGLTVIGGGEAPPADLSGLDAARERLACCGGQPLPESALAPAFPPGSLESTLERHRLDAVWIVTGIVVLSMGTAASGDPETPGSRLLLRAALVDGTATIRFSDMTDGRAIATHGPAPGAAGPIDPAEADVRLPDVARRAVEALLAEYRTEEEKRLAGQSVTRALNTRAESPRSPHPAGFRIGLGVFVFAGMDLWAGFIPRDSRWQVGYRYARWTDQFEDPYTGSELTETTETVQGPQVNYLFRPEKRGTWYLGMPLLRWSKTETARMNGVTDSESVVAPFVGGGYTRRLGRHGYWNGAMFLAPWAELKTDTGVSSEESSGGFDIQLQIGASF